MNASYIWAKVLKKARLSAIIRSEIHPTSKVEPGSHVVDSTFGRHSFCGYDCEILCADVGSFCSIANRVVIGGVRHPMEWVGMSPVFYAGRDSIKAKFATHQMPPLPRTVIGHDVWIAYGAMIGQGIKIGNGAVVGMGSVVVKDIPDYTIVAGNPAREIRRRFPDDVIRALTEIRWWNLDDAELRRYALRFTDPLDFIREFSKR